MGKFAKYTKKFNKEWEKEPSFKGWLQESQTGSAVRFVNSANYEREFYHKTDLLKHKSTKLHMKNLKKFNLVPSDSKKIMNNLGIFITSVSDEKKIGDIKYSVYIAMHSAIMSINHLSELVNETSSEQNLRLHKTKCTAIIKNVISPALLEDLIADLGTSPYSLILDESTDISVVKYLAMCIRYFSVKKETIKTEYLAMIEVGRTRASDLYENVKTCLNQNKIDIKNLVGIGTDGASNLCGVNNSLYTLLQTDVPKLVLIKCIINNTIHNCTSKAIGELPSSESFFYST